MNKFIAGDLVNVEYWNAGMPIRSEGLIIEHVNEMRGYFREGYMVLVTLCGKDYEIFVPVTNVSKL